MKVLFFANLIPFPLDGGGKIFTFSVLKSLKECGHTVDIVCFYENENIDDAIKALRPYCNSIKALPIKVTTRENMGLMMMKAIASIFSNKPLAISKYVNSSMKATVREIMKDNNYDCAFYNLLAMYSYAPIVKQTDPSVRTILYEQNCEAMIYKRYLKETNNLLKKLFLMIETKKLEDFEQNSIKNVDELILLSNEDKNALKVDRESCNIIPIGVRPSEYQKKYDTCNGKIRMLFVGTMTWAPNNEGIIWFLENVMPKCADVTKYELYIVGKNPSDKVKALASVYENVYLLGYVESLEEYYEKCDVLVVPLFIGSGQRVKIIEAFSKAYPVISTSIGLEGLKYIDDKTVMVANDANTFMRKIEKCSDYDLLREIGRAGKEIFDSEYSTEIIKEKINEVIS